MNILVQLFRGVSNTKPDPTLFFEELVDLKTVSDEALTRCEYIPTPLAVFDLEVFYPFGWLKTYINATVIDRYINSNGNYRLI